MAMIDDRHVEWRVVARLRDLLDHPPGAEHDVTLTYSLFTAILCWTCQRIRDDNRPDRTWEQLQRERASGQPWGVLDLRIEKVVEGPLETLPASVFLVGLRNAVAHGDDRKIRPLHVGTPSKADRRLAAFVFETAFYDSDTKQSWGRSRLSLTTLDMRRICIALAGRFCDNLSEGARHDAERHVLVG